MHDLQFADSIRPAPVICLRLPLLPYTIGHELLLLQQRNPFLIFSETEFNQLSALEQCRALGDAVLICCRDWEANKKPHLWVGLWAWTNRKANYPLEIAEFRNYLNAGRALLPVPEKEADEIANGENKDKGRELGAPFLAQLINFLSAGRSLRAASSIFDTSYATAAALYFTHLESEGAYKIENRRENEIRREMAEHRRAIESGEESGSPSSEFRPPQSDGLATPPPAL